MFHVLPYLPDLVLPKNGRTRVTKEEAWQWFTKVCQPLNELLNNQDYLVDNRFTAADVVTGGVLLWALKLGMMKQESPVKNYIMKLMDRPAFNRADENLYAKVD